MLLLNRGARVAAKNKEVGCCLCAAGLRHRQIISELHLSDKNVTGASMQVYLTSLSTFIGTSNCKRFTFAIGACFCTAMWLYKY